MDMIRLLHRMLRQGMAVEAGPHLGKRISRRRDGLDEILKEKVGPGNSHGSRCSPPPVEPSDSSGRPFLKK